MTLQTREGLTLPTGWYAAPTEVRKRLLLSVGAPKGWGKTTFTLGSPKLGIIGAPAPIFYYKIETGDEGVVEPVAASGKEIYTYRAYYSRLNWRETWDALMSSVAETCTLMYGKQGTVVFDTFTETYELGRLAHFGGRLSQVVPREYGVVYADLKEMIRMVEGAGLNGVFIHRMGPQFDNKSVLEYKGWEDHRWDMQAILDLKRYDSQQVLGGEEAPFRYLGYISECRQKGELVGQWLGHDPNHPFDFDFLLRWVHA